MPNSKIQYLDCPHCYSNVMFRQDGICLSCRKNRFDTQGVNPDETMVTIDHNHRLPRCCFLCGVETPLKKNLAWSYYTGSKSSWLSLMFSYVPGSQCRAIHDINMPVCLTCTPLAKHVKPLSVIAGLECRVLVHRQFRQQFEQLNGKEYIEWQAEIRINNSPNMATQRKFF